MRKIFTANTPSAQKISGVFSQLVADLTLAIKKADKSAAEAELTLRAENSSGCLLPDASQDDAGKILTIGNTEHIAMQSFDEFYTVYENIFLGVGHDKSQAYIVVNTDVFLSLKIFSPLDPRCEFGFTFIPERNNYSLDYDVIIDKAEETENGEIKLYFPIESCPLFKKEIKNISALQKHFEQIRFCGEYPVNEKGPVWVSPETAFPPSFLDQYILSPAVSLAKEYTDRVCLKIPEPDRENAILFHEKDGKFSWLSKEELFREILEYVRLKI